MKISVFNNSKIIENVNMPYGLPYKISMFGFSVEKSNFRYEISGDVYFDEDKSISTLLYFMDSIEAKIVSIDSEDIIIDWIF